MIRVGILYWRKILKQNKNTLYDKSRNTILEKNIKTEQELYLTRIRILYWRRIFKQNKNTLSDKNILSLKNI